MLQSVIGETFHSSLNQETREHQRSGMGFVSHRGITLILISMSVIHPVCLFDVYLIVSLHSLT